MDFVIVDVEKGTEYYLETAHGLSFHDFLKVNPKVKKFVSFTFPFPYGVKKINCESSWDGGTHGYTVTQISIPVKIPPPE